MNKKPQHVPDLAWAAAQTLFEVWKDGAPMHSHGAEDFQRKDTCPLCATPPAPMHRQCAEDLERVLKDPDLKGTFKRLSEKLFSDRKWIVFFECIANLRGTLAENLREVLKETDERRAQIAELARKLSRQVWLYCKATEEHGISRDSSLSSLEDLVIETYERERSQNWLWIKQALTDHQRSSYFRHGEGNEITELLNAIASGPDGPSHELNAPYNYAEIGRARPISGITRFSIADAVRFFDNLIEYDLAPLMVRGLHVSDTDLANILTALLEPDLPPENPKVSRQAVKKARNRE